MTSTLNTHLAPLHIEQRLRSAREDRSKPPHTYSVPTVHENPRPLRTEALGATDW
jgi:hypothetical protein